MAKKFVLKRGDHTVVTTVAGEAHQLRSIGYRDEVEKPAPKPAPKPDTK